MDTTGAVTVHVELSRGTRRFISRLVVHPGKEFYAVRTVSFGRTVSTIELSMADGRTGYVRCRCGRCPEETRVTMGCPDRYIRFVFQLSRPTVDLSLNESLAPVPLSRSETVLLGPVPGITFTSGPTIPMHEIIILVEYSLIESWFAEEDRTIPPALASLFGECRAFSGALVGCTTPRMDLALRQLVTCDPQGCLARVYQEATIHELIVMRLAQLDSDPIAAVPVVLMRRDLERLEQARVVLGSTYRNPPKIGELSRMVGLNRTKLKAGFRQRYGTTVCRYIRSQRMNHAYRALRDGSCNVTEAAGLVGYSSLSAFSAAFKDEFDVSPCRVRGTRIAAVQLRQSPCSQPSVN